MGFESRKFAAWVLVPLAIAASSASESPVLANEAASMHSMSFPLASLARFCSSVGRERCFRAFMDMSRVLANAARSAMSSAANAEAFEHGVTYTLGNYQAEARGIQVLIRGSSRTGRIMSFVFKFRNAAGAAEEVAITSEGEVGILNGLVSGTEGAMTLLETGVPFAEGVITRVLPIIMVKMCMDPATNTPYMADKDGHCIRTGPSIAAVPDSAQPARDDGRTFSDPSAPAGYDRAL